MAGQGRWGQVITIFDLVFWMMQLWSLISVCGIKEALMSGRIEEMSGRVELNPGSGVSWETRGRRPVARSRSAGEEIIMGLLGVHNDLLVEERQLVVVEEEVAKQAEERDVTAVLAAFPEYKSILLETQVVYTPSYKKNIN